MREKPVVVEYNDVFFYKSETFIYNFVSNLKNFHPVYFAREFSNLELFPFPGKDRYSIPAAVPDIRDLPWPYRIRRKLLNVDISGEEMILRKRKAMLIHAHFGPQGFFALDIRGRLKIPLVTSFYGYDVSELSKQPLWQKRYGQLFKEGDIFLVEGRYMKARLVELGCPEAKIRIQRIAIPVKGIPFIARRAKKNNEKIVFVFCGRFVEKKGTIFALRAFKKLSEKFDNFEFRIIGDGELRSTIEHFISENRMDAVVKLLGFLDYREYLKEMQNADIFVHPSVTAENGDSEGGAPTTILEAQAQGLPVVSTYHADIPNIVVAGKSALLSKENDVDALVDNLAYLIDNQDVWEKMGAAGREFVEKYHDIKNELEGLESIYRELIYKTIN
jgi:colanic acid/amylovoran biosynthesis glycosyltransferase